MENLYDFIIIGGGPTGSTVGTLLAQKGYKVILLEKEKFPRRHVGESMLSPAYFLFEKLGVLDSMKQLFVRKPGVVFTNSDGTSFTNWCFRNVIKNDSALSFHVERAVFDKLLLDNSKVNGVKVYEGTKVVGVDLTKDIVKVAIQSKNNLPDKNITGKFLVDASGQGSFLAQKFNSKIPYEGIGNRVALFGHWEGINMDETLKEGNLKIVYLDVPNGGWMWMVPLNPNKLSIGVVIDSDFYKQKRKEAQLEKNTNWQEIIYQEMIKVAKLTAPILSRASMINQVAISSDYSYQNTNKFGKNYAAIGDAAGFIDPIFASGVYIGMNSAFLLVEALDDVFRKSNENALSLMYEKLDRAYYIVQQLISNYYDKEAIQFDNLHQFINPDYEQHKTAFDIFNLLIAGQFFDAPKNYENTIKLLKKERMRSSYKHCIGYNENALNAICLREAPNDKNQS